jgi:hypothetical protein
MMDECAARPRDKVKLSVCESTVDIQGHKMMNDVTMGKGIVVVCVI